MKLVENNALHVILSSRNIFLHLLEKLPKQSAVEVSKVGVFISH